MGPKKYFQKQSVRSDFPGELETSARGIQKYLEQGKELAPTRIPPGFQSRLSPGRMAGAAAGIGGAVGGGAALWQLLDDMDGTAPLSDPGPQPEVMGPPTPVKGPQAHAYLNDKSVGEADLQKAPGKVFRKKAPRVSTPAVDDGSEFDFEGTDMLGDGLQDPPAPGYTVKSVRQVPVSSGEVPTPFQDPMEQRINERLRYRRR